MRVRVDSRELRRYVVRVGGHAGQILGTGFFVAPGWVLTCAHVVGDTRELVVTPVNSGPVGEGVAAVVKARSDPPPQSGGLWPFPDLALLQLKRQIDHPCVLLDAREPAGELDCHAWGFARREEGVAPIGSPASFRYEGVEGDGYLRLKQGQAAPGLSGAPLICPVRRAVVGVVFATRDVRTDLGGWASPISALLFGGSGVPHELVELGAGLRQPNHDAVVAQRDLWNRVLPVEDAEDLLKQPWERFTRQPRSSPSSLLLAEHAVVPYLFRDRQLGAAVAWCDDATRMSNVERCRTGRGRQDPFCD
ncbi:MAG: serine protease [Solirubrobacteraceae bacterium]|jgi:hypothetical protein